VEMHTKVILGQTICDAAAIIGNATALILEFYM
jgi:hypothetical protein